MKCIQPLTEERINSISKNFTTRNKVIWGRYNDIAVLYNEISDLKDFIEKASDSRFFPAEQQEKIENLHLAEVMDGFRLVAAQIAYAAGQIQSGAKSFLLDRAFEEYEETAPDAFYFNMLRAQINNLYTLMNHIRHDLKFQLTAVTNI